MAKIFPSLISADLVNLAHAIEVLEPHCAGFHLEVMDFRFAPHLTWGPGFIDAIRKVAHKPLWVHLLVEEPEKYLDHLALHEHDIVTIHYENMSNNHLTRIFHALQERKLKASLSLNPKTPLEVVKHFMHYIDQVVLMGVEPGMRGQVLLPSTYERLDTLYVLREEHSLKFSIGIDGGVNDATIKELVKKGANDLTVASAIFDAPNPAKALQELNRLAA